MTWRYQRGSSTLIAVILLLVFGLLLLNSLHRQLDSTLLIGSDERRYLRAYNQALSSLSWGLTRTWAISPSSGSILPKSTLPESTLSSRIPPWHCEDKPDQGVKACIKPAISPGIFLIKGESQSLAWQSPIMLYQRVVPENQFIETGKSLMTGVINGVLDFCPEKDEKFCDE